MSPANQIHTLLDLALPPVAIAFRSEPPDGVTRVPARAASGCTYWRQAADGATFYTEPSDHYGCPVGSHTHGLELPEENAKELQCLVETMVGLQYITMDDVGGLPRLAGDWEVAVYAPADKAPVDPDVVVVRGRARQIMLLAEAARALGPDGALMGRPACAVIPEAMRSGRAATSLGCIGNRVYTGLADDEFYFALPGAQLAAVAEQLATIVHANEALQAFHESRRT
jgi:uncharacterized protein (DUF169 family)